MATQTLGRVQSPRIIRIGRGAALELAEVLAQLGLSRPLIVTDAGLVALGHVTRITDVLDRAALPWGLFDGVTPDPTDACVDQGLTAFRAGSYDCIIGFGGGSPMDAAKAISFMSVNPGHVRDYKAPAQIDRCGVPMICIPTTGGTGEAYVSRKAHPYTDGFALQAMPLIAKHVRRAYADPEDAEAREALMLAASLAGMAFSNASVALIHGMSRPIGAHFHVAHGLSNAMLLPAVTAFSVAHAQPRYADCARIMGLAQSTDTDQTACAKLVEGLTRLNTDLQVPTPSQLGHTASPDMLELMANQALASGSPQNNPRVPTGAEIISQTSGWTYIGT